MGILDVRVHHLSECSGLNVVAKINDITLEVGGINFGEIDINDSNVLGVFLCAKTKLNGGV